MSDGELWKARPGPLARLYWSAFTAWHLRGQSRLPYLAPERLAAIQNRRVRRIVAHAYATVPYYREALDRAGIRPGDVRTAGDLARLPLVDSRELATDPQAFRSSQFTARQVHESQSSGTSGHNKSVGYDLPALFLGWAEGQRRRNVMAALVGRSRAARVLEFRLPGGIIEQQHALLIGHTLAPRPMLARRAALPPTASVEEACDALNDFQPEIVHGYGSFVGSLFRQAHERALPFHHPLVLLYHSDNMPEADRRLIEEGLGIPVISSYVACETLFIAFQCERRSAFHVDVDRVAVRVVDAEGNPVQAGQRGEIVVSNLTNRATVILNYRLGDMVTVGAAPCPCGRTLPTLESIDGRADDLLIRADGTPVHGLGLLTSHEALASVVQLQVRQLASQRFLLRVVPSPGADHPTVAVALTSELRALVGPEAEVEVQFVDVIAPEAGGKVRAVVREI